MGEARKRAAAHLLLDPEVMQVHCPAHETQINLRCGDSIHVVSQRAHQHLRGMGSVVWPSNVWSALSAAMHTPEPGGPSACWRVFCRGSNFGQPRQLPGVLQAAGKALQVVKAPGVSDETRGKLGVPRQ